MLKKLYSHIVLSFVLCLIAGTSLGQVERGGEPVSWNLTEAIDPTLQIVDLPIVNSSALLAEDEQGIEDRGLPYRFAVSQDVDLNNSTDGRWTTLNNGDRIWQLALSSDGAVSMSVTFDEFYLPKGTVLYVFTADRSSVLGAFTSANNKDGQKFTTTHLPGDQLIIEYYEPLIRRDQGSISVQSIAHAYKNHINTNLDNDCLQNLGCGTAQDLNTLGSSVVRLTVARGTKYTTGVLLNNASFNGRPLVLTTFDPSLGDPATWVATFNWVDEDCTGLAINESTQSISGATLLKANSEYGFALVELSLKPLVEWDIEYAGWSRTGSTPQMISSIHHAEGQVKKLNTSTLPPVHHMQDAMMFWDISSWDVGTSLEGSVGAPLFDENNRMIAWYIDGNHNCSSAGFDTYARLHEAWAELEKYLDPFNSGVQVVNGFNPGYDQIDQRIIQDQLGIFPNPAINKVNIINDSNEGFEFIQIFNAQGQIVRSETYKGGPIFLGDLSRGTYLLKFQLETSVINKKVILN
ncbi:MAG: T9SS type A sorting domain-containing protein [Flavobacteriales bacterium]